MAAGAFRHCWHAEPVPQQILYNGWERPLVEVLVDDTWYPGELRAWLQAADESWTANVSWTKRPGETYLDTVTADRVRPVDS